MRKLAKNLARRKRNFELLRGFLAKRPEIFVLPEVTPGIETAWHMFPFLLRPESGVVRGEFQKHMESNGIDTRMVWSGNIARQPAFRKRAHRIAPGGLGNCDRVMETGLILPCNHGIDDDGVAYMGEVIERFFA